MPVINTDIGGAACTLLIPPDRWNAPGLPCFYVNGGSDSSELFNDIERLYYKKNSSLGPAFVMISHCTSDWDRDYSPWKAEVSGRVYDGEADRVLERIKEKVAPAAEELYGTDPMKRITMGYSLGALASLYFFTKDSFFRACACLSGSLWFPGTVSYIKETEIEPGNGRLMYLSLGKKEIKTRHPLMKQNGEFYEEALKRFSEVLGEDSSVFEWNNGGHGFEVTERHLKAVNWILERI